MIQEIKYGGYSAKPSDYISPDGELAQVGNLVPEDGELHPVFPPSQLLNLDGWQVLFVHDTPDYKHYILSKIVNNAGLLAWCPDTYTDLSSTAPTVISGFPTDAAVKKVQAIGNTLVILTDKGVEYVLWGKDENDDDNYICLGQQPPQVYITFGLGSELVCYPDRGDDATMLNSSVDERNVPFKSWSGNEDLSYVPPREKIATITNPDYSMCNVSLKDTTGDDGGGEIALTINRITNWALGAVNRLVSEQAEKGRFTMPFFIRYAYELYDGTTIMHSYPVLMMPNSRAPILALNSSTCKDYGGLSLKDNNDHKIAYRLRGRAYAFASNLTMKYNTDYTELAKWSDIVRAVNIYVTPPIYTYEQDGQVFGWKEPEEGFWDTFYTIASISASHVSSQDHPNDNPDADYALHRARMFRDDFVNDEGNKRQNSIYNDNPIASPSELEGAMFAGFGDMTIRIDDTDVVINFPLPSYIMDIPERSSDKMQELIANESRFYRIVSIPIDEFGASGEMAPYSLPEGVLQSLVARPKLEDDYHSRDHIEANTAFMFNSRLSLGAVKRTHHIPLPAAVEWTRYDSADDNNPRQWVIGAHTNDKGNKQFIFGNQPDTQRKNGINFPLYVFYPDTAAKDAVMTCEGIGNNASVRYFTTKLDEHAFLNGAFWLDDIRHPMCLRNDLWGSSVPTGLAHGVSVTPTPAAFPTGTNNPVNELAKVYTSDVNNPFRFPLNGINTVGTSEILALCATTKPLSQGQFGQFPLYVFTNEGIWALESASDGTFATRHPVTRDICNNPESITQLDDSIVFATEQGIMQLVGGTTQCISRQLETPTADWQEFLDGCRITYDYINQRIILYHQPVTTTSGTTKYYPNYVLSLRDKEWGMMDGAFVYNINAYPYALVVNSDGKLMDISHPVVQQVNATLCTRPLKLNLPNVLKTVDTVIQRGMFDFNDATRGTKPVQSILEGSRDLYNWYTIASSTDHYLRFSSGTPYKFFRIRLILKLKPGESVYGCTVQFTPRLTNQPR